MCMNNTYWPTVLFMVIIAHLYTFLPLYFKILCSYLPSITPFAHCKRRNRWIIYMLPGLTLLCQYFLCQQREAWLLNLINCLCRVIEWWNGPRGPDQELGPGVNCLVEWNSDSGLGLFLCSLPPLRVRGIRGGRYCLWRKIYHNTSLTVFKHWTIEVKYTMKQ